MMEPRCLTKKSAAIRIDQRSVKPVPSILRLKISPYRSIFSASGNGLPPILSGTRREAVLLNILSLSRWALPLEFEMTGRRMTWKSMDGRLRSNRRGISSLGHNNVFRGLFLAYGQLEGGIPSRVK